MTKHVSARGGRASQPFFMSSSNLALRILHFMCSGGMLLAPPVNLTWLFLKVFTSLCFTGTGLDSSRFFIFAMACSDDSVLKQEVFLLRLNIFDFILDYSRTLRYTVIFMPM